MTAHVLFVGDRAVVAAYAPPGAPRRPTAWTKAEPPHQQAAAFERAFELSPDPTSGVLATAAIIATDRRLSYLSPLLENWLGHERDFWIGRDVLELVWPDDAARTTELFELALRSPSRVFPCRLRVRHRDGTLRSKARRRATSTIRRSMG